MVHWFGHVTHPRPVVPHCTQDHIHGGGGGGEKPVTMTCLVAHSTADNSQFKATCSFIGSCLGTKTTVESGLLHKLLMSVSRVCTTLFLYKYRCTAQCQYKCTKGVLHSSPSSGVNSLPFTLARAPSAFCQRTLATQPPAVCQTSKENTRIP